MGDPQGDPGSGSTGGIAVFASGGGRSLENLHAVHLAGDLPAPLGLLLTDRPGIGALERASRLSIPHLTLPWKEHADADAFGAAAFSAVEAHGCSLVVLAGFLRRLVIPHSWLGRVINIHPALLPAFGGKGYFGEHVHRAVLAAGVQESGCTVHFADDDYDHGHSIVQLRVPVLPHDTPATLAARVFVQEKLALPEAIRLVLSGRASPPE